MLRTALQQNGTNHNKTDGTGNVHQTHVAFFIPFAKDIYMSLAKQILPAGALNTGTVNLPKTVKRGKYGGYFYTQGTC